MIDLDASLGRTVSYQGTTHDKLRETLTPNAYGVGWCMSDLMRLEDENMRALTLDALGGFQRGRFYAELRSTVLIQLETIDRKQFELFMSRPEGRPQGWQGIHFHPRQTKWRCVATMPAVFSVPVSGEIEAQSALWLLHKYGWMTREYAKERWRYTQTWPFTWEHGKKKISEAPVYVDNWRLVETAFYKMHPEHTPDVWRIDNGKEEKEQEGQKQVASTVVSEARHVTIADKKAKLREYQQAYRAKLRAAREDKKQALA